MRLRDQIIAASCTGWISVLGAGIYFACEARPSRAGVIREGSAGGTRLADPGAQDARSRPGNRQGTPPESRRQSVGSPGYAQCHQEPCSADLPESWVAGSREEPLPSDGSAQSVSSRPLPVSSATRVLAEEAGRGHFQPYVVTGYSHGCILPRFGVEGPPRRGADGEWPIPNITVAADRSMPFGTVLEAVYKGLPSRLVVGDRGRWIRGNRLDLFLRSCEEARAWGRRVVMARVVEGE